MQNKVLRPMEGKWILKKNSKLIRRKIEARSHKKISKMSKKLRGLKGKIFHKERYKEKAEMHKKVKAHQEKDVQTKKAKNND